MNKQVEVESMGFGFVGNITTKQITNQAKYEQYAFVDINRKTLQLIFASIIFMSFVLVWGGVGKFLRKFPVHFAFTDSIAHWW
jgi:hypothetical protein